MGTTSMLYFLELQSISERVTSFSEGSQQVPAPPAIAAHLLLQSSSHNFTAKAAMHKLCLHIRLMALHRELAPPKTQSSAAPSGTSVDTE